VGTLCIFVFSSLALLADRHRTQNAPSPPSPPSPSGGVPGTVATAGALGRRLSAKFMPRFPFVLFASSIRLGLRSCFCMLRRT
jgi:hypothetical protein